MLEVVKVDPVSDQAAGMLKRFEAVPMHALLLERADHTVVPGVVRMSSTMCCAVD